MQRNMVTKSPGMDAGIHVQRLDCTRVVTLNRPNVLNVLNLPMIKALYPRLKEWEEEPDIKMILLKGKGKKAFCAGGDVLSVIKSAQEDNTLHHDFFREEYRLNYLIGTYKLPLVSIIDGITMGGGCGLSMHGRFRVATDRTILAMPETAIGLFPDVGGSYFLPRLPGRLGLYLALTGYRLRGADAVHSGFATHFVPSDKLSAMEEALQKMRPDEINELQIDRLIRRFQVELPAFSLRDQVDIIDKLFDGSSVEEIVGNLERDESEWANKQTALLAKMSPTSLKVTFRQLSQGARLCFKDVFTMEYRLSQHFLQDNDFFEGCRAILIDKDNSPNWNPATLAEVTENKLDWYFSPLPADQELFMKPF